MKRKTLRVTGFGMVLAAFTTLTATTAQAGGHYEEFDEFLPIIEINATDGDIGYHVLLDGPGWRLAKIFDSDKDRMFKGTGTDDLLEQGITELFMESAEPPCNPEDADEDEEVVDLEEFIDRFEAGVYYARGRTIEDVPLRKTGELTHNIPAAPIAEVEVGTDEDDEEELEVVISWESGVDLGRCAFEDLVTDGVIPHPMDVEVVRWEVVVEPDEDELPEGVAFAKFTMQFTADVDEVEVPEEYFEAYLDAGVTEFKAEVGAREESGNQTFTEFEFSLDEEEE